MSQLRVVLLLLLVTATPALCVGQEPVAPSPPPVASPAADESTPPETAPPEAGAETHLAGSPGVGGFFKDVGHDYAQWFTLDTLRPLTLGTATALFVRPFDNEITEDGLFDQIGSSLGAGQEYGNVSFQGPLAVGWWVVGHAVGSKRASAAGRDLVRAQISAASWTYVIKYAVRRTRPNGDARSFPSGHSSATFATATVLQTHYGWKVGLPFYALGVYTAASRIHDRKHWLSDTVMGAAVGVTAGRAVTIRLRQHPVRVVPAITHGGGMVQFVVDP